MPIVVRIVPAAILSAAIVVSAAACGSAQSRGSAASDRSATTVASPLAGLTADQIVLKATHDLSAASSVRIVGTAVSADESASIDLIDVPGQGCRGTMALTVKPGASSTGPTGTGTMAVIELDGNAYTKFSQSYLKSVGAPASVLTEIAGKYIEVSPSKISGLAPMCDISDIANGLQQEASGFAQVGTATVDGGAALAFKGPRNGADGAVYVSESATPEIVRIAGPTGEGAVDFSDYGVPVTITAPPAADIVNGSTLGL